MSDREGSINYEGERGQLVLAAGDAASTKPLFFEYLELTKPRLSLLSVITAIVGYLAALPARDSSVLISLVAGTSLAAGGAAALNMWMEKESDALMVRTRDRPVPSGTISSASALALGLVLCAGGDILLLIGVNGLAAFLALATQATYLLAYTPSKKETSWCTEIGAIPGALPPLIGWAGAGAGISALGWVLFAILLFWQIPHFMAIAWTHREDYRRAGFPMATVVDGSGRTASLKAFVCTITLVLCSLLPTVLGFTTAAYAAVAGIAGTWFLVRSFRFLAPSTRDSEARRLFFASIAYLPILLAALVIDRILLV